MKTLFDYLDKWPKQDSPPPKGMELEYESLVQDNEEFPTFALHTLKLHQGVFASESEAVADFDRRAVEELLAVEDAARATSVTNAIRKLYDRKYYGPYLVLCRKPTEGTKEYDRIEGVEGVLYNSHLPEGVVILVQNTPDVVRCIVPYRWTGGAGGRQFSLTLQLRRDFYNNVGVARVQK